MREGDASAFATSSVWLFAELSVGGVYRLECFSPCVIRLLRVLEKADTGLTMFRNRLEGVLDGDLLCECSSRKATSSFSEVTLHAFNPLFVQGRTTFAVLVRRFGDY